MGSSDKKFHGHVFLNTQDINPHVLYCIMKKKHSSTSLLAFVRPWWRIKWKHCPRYWPFVWGIHRWIPLTKASDADFDVFFDMHLNKRLSKQSWCWLFETSSRSLWRHCNGKSLIWNHGHISQGTMRSDNWAFKCSETIYNRADSMLAHSQWETSLHSNAVSHWLGANLESAMYN